MRSLLFSFAELALELAARAAEVVVGRIDGSARLAELERRNSELMVRCERAELEVVAGRAVDRARVREIELVRAAAYRKMGAS